MSKAKIDGMGLAEQPNQLTYEEKPVENYGINLLKNMGFSEARGIGRKSENKKADILVLKPRPRGLGLGAEVPQQKQKEKYQIGDRILIIEDPHKDLCGKINSVISEDQMEVELYPSNSLVRIKTKNLKKISKQEMKKQMEKWDDIGKEEQGKKKKKLKWVVPQIRVKIIDSKSPNYLKKVIVTELISEREFQCRDENGKILSNLTEKMVQTCVPKEGGSVLILKGNHLGAKAVVIERKKNKGKVTVQTIEQLELVKISQDDVSQYVPL